MQKEVTTNEIMEFLKEHTATKTDIAEFRAEVNRKFATKEDMAKMELRIYDKMDDKLSDLRGDIVILMRKGSKGVMELVELLRKKKVLTEDEELRLHAIQPFPQR